MSYFFVFILLFLPLFSSYGQEATDEPQHYTGGVVTTRTGGSVTTRSSAVPSRRRAGQRPSRITKYSDTKKKPSRIDRTVARTTVKPRYVEENSTADVLKNQARSYREQGYKMQLAGDVRGALMYYQKANQMDPTYVEVYNDIGVVYEGLNDEDKALKMYKNALEVDPHYLPTYANLAMIYEKKGDISNASFYWQKRYELGQEGEYWREVARQHLLKLGTYPEVRKDQLEQKAAQLSRDLTFQREESKEKVIEEAQLHFDLGANLLLKKDYASAMQEFQAAITLNPADEQLKDKCREYYKNAEKLYVKEQALANTQDALNYIKNEDYLTAGEKLKNALTSVFRIDQEK